MAEQSRFAKGYLNGVMAAYPHVADWVRDFESRYPLLIFLSFKIFLRIIM